MTNLQLFAIIGRPIAFSRSPYLYNRAFSRWGLKAHYLRLSSFSLDEAWSLINELNIQGFNVTSPYKEKIIPYLRELSPEAAAIGAVNTVVRTEKGFKGYNTDPEGLMTVRQSLNLNFKGKKILVLGAGGAARAALFTLNKFTSELWLTNRTPDKGRWVAKKFGSLFLPPPNIAEKLSQFDIILSCIARPDLLLPINKLSEKTILLEASYQHLKSPSASETLRIKKTSFLRPVTGLEWLLGQGIKALEIYYNQRPDSFLRQILREEIYNPPSPPQNIALIGFMGCGKSTIGRVLAAKLGSDFIDTDEIIEREKGMSILQIFSRWGEEYFRQLERSFLPPLLQKAKNCVIALGGGAVKDPVIRKNLSSSSLTIWVWSSLEECLKRNQGKPKPLLIRNSSPQQQERLFQERIPLYARASNLVMTNRDGQLSSTVRLTYEEINSSF